MLGKQKDTEDKKYDTKERSLMRKVHPGSLRKKQYILSSDNTAMHSLIH